MMTQAKHIGHIKRIAAEVRRELVPRGRAGLICQPAAEEITRRLRAEKIKARTIKGHAVPTSGDHQLRHYWTEAEGLLIDVTIDQLGRGWPKVLIEDAQTCRDHTELGIIYSPDDEFLPAIRGSYPFTTIEAIRRYRKNL